MSLEAPTTIIHQLEQLVNEHRQLDDEPLLLAVHFVPVDNSLGNSGDIFLLEVIDGFGAGRISEDRELFHVSYAASANFPLPAGKRLHLFLTNPQEFERAAIEKWPSFEEVRKGYIKEGTIVFADPARPDLEAKIHG